MSKLKKLSPPALPLPGEGKRGEKGHVGYLLRQAAAGFRGRMDRALAELGITAPQFVVLTLVGAYPGISNAELARISHLTPQTVFVIGTNLKKSGAVASQPHSTHGRVQQLMLTAVGEKILFWSKPVIQDLEQQLVAGLTAPEEVLIRRWLTRVATATGSA